MLWFRRNETGSSEPPVLWQLITIIFPIFSIILVGFFYGQRHAPDMAAANKLNIDLFAPALIFHILSAKDFSLGDYQGLAVGSFLVVLGSGLVAWPVARFFGYSVKTFVPPMMFSNSGNMGLPLALFAFGESALPAAVVLFIIENLLHFTIGQKMMDSHAPLSGLLRMPMLIATFAGLLVASFRIPIPVILATPIEMIGQVAIPLMLFSLGVRLISIDWRDWRIGLVGAVIAPVSGLLLALVFLSAVALPKEQMAQLLVFGALPPAVLNFMVAERFDQEPHLVAAIVMMGNLASLLFIPLVLVFVL